MLRGEVVAWLKERGKRDFSLQQPVGGEMDGE